MKTELSTNIAIKTPVIHFMNLPVKLTSIYWDPCLIMDGYPTLFHAMKLTSWISAYLYKSLSIEQYLKLHKKFKENKGQYLFKDNKIIYADSKKTFIEVCFE